MHIDLRHKKALVGAASAGIGKGIAQVLASCGASITLVARNAEKLQQTLAELDRSKGQKHQYLLVDYNDHAQYKASISAYFQKNQVDILVNNSNGPLAGTVAEKELQDYQQAFELLFQNHCFTVLQALPGMKRNAYGRIINVSSLTVKEPNAQLVLSNSIRTALMSWSKSLADEVAADNITVNSILTGFFNTDRIRSITENIANQNGISYEEALQARINSIPAKRLGTAQEYGQLVAFISSEYASYLTGTSIPLDGGLLRTW